jgi:superfamily II DNA or RNA helicase
MIYVKEAATKLRLTGPPDQLEKLRASFRYHPANYWMSDAYQLYKRTDGKHGWDGYLYPMRLFRAKNYQLVAEIDRGFLDDVLAKLRQFNFEANLDGLLIRPFQGLASEDVPPDILRAEFELDELQRQGVAAWLEHVIGINYVTVAGGKTAMLAAAAAMVKRRYPDARFLYFTASERLVRQVHAELTKFLPDWHITRFGGGGKDHSGKDVVVATGAMLNAHFDRLKAARWFETFMGVLVDECHHASSPTWVKVLKCTPAFFRFGASDTLCEDDPARWHTIRGLLGPVRAKIEAQHLIKEVALSMASAGRLAKPHIYLVDIPAWAGKFRHLSHAPEPDTEAWALVNGAWQKGLYLGPVFEYDPEAEDHIKRDQRGEPVKLDNYHQLLLDGQVCNVESRWCLLQRTRDQAIIRFNERNRLIVAWATYYSSLGWPTLVVCTPTLHILILKALLAKALGAHAGLVKVLYSEHTSRERDEAFGWLQATPGAILISSLVKEGVSLPAIRGGVVADYVAGWEPMRQVIGRFIRKKSSDNYACVTTFVERQHPKLVTKSIQMLDKLSKTRGFTFYHPVSTPESLPQAARFDAR